MPTQIRPTTGKMEKVNDSIIATAIAVTIKLNVIHDESGAFITTRRI